MKIPRSISQIEMIEIFSKIEAQPTNWTEENAGEKECFNNLYIENKVLGANRAFLIRKCPDFKYFFIIIFLLYYQRHPRVANIQLSK